MCCKVLLGFLVVVSCVVGRVESKSTELSIQEKRFAINGTPTFLLGISYYGALGASQESIHADLDDMQRYGFNWLRVWANWSSFDHCVSAVDAKGGSRQPYLDHLKWLVEQCDNRGMIVDVTLNRTQGNDGEGKLPTQEAHLHAVETLVVALKPYRNWYLDLANERNVQDARFVSMEELKELRARVREISPDLLVTASDGGDFDKKQLKKYLSTVRVDFIAPHRGRSRDIFRDTAAKSHEYIEWMHEVGRVVPLHYQEPFRRGYSPKHWEPTSVDFAIDLHQAIAGGAAGWCFHNGDQRNQPGGQPRRSFDMRDRRLFEQLDQHERSFIQNARKIVNRLRIIVETDAGGDPDDEQSLVRFLLYSNEWDVEGIICNRPQAREGENRNSARTGLEIVQRLVSAYGECFPNLITHDAFYPSPKRLHELTVPGYSDSDEGIKLILDKVNAFDSRPIWFMNWGTDRGSAPSSLKRSLDHLLAERGIEVYQRFKTRLRISGDDRFGPHTTEILPAFPIWVNTKEPEIDGRRWYRRFGPLTAQAGQFDLVRDLLTGHGPLGALYPTNTDIPQKEGDSSEFLYLVPTGMNDPENPTWGSWAGRYGPNYLATSERRVYWANQTDEWNGSTDRENSLSRWAADFQNDFKARLDWCVTQFAQANHPPTPVLNGHYGGDILHISARPDETVRLDAAGTFDVDEHELSYQWFNYREPSSYSGEVVISSPTAQAIELTVPSDAVDKSIHVVLIVQDSGQPPLTRYRRAIITGRLE